MKKVLVLSAVAASLAAASCTKEIDFEYRDIEPILVVEASLTQSEARVRLSETTPMDEAIDDHPLLDAEVSITDLSDGSVVALSPDAGGCYTAPAGGVSGREYLLQVERAGRSYSSACLMTEPCAAPVLEFGWIEMPYDRVAVMQVSFADATEQAGDCYWLRIYRNGRTYKWSPVTDSAASDGIINVTMMTSRLDDIENPEETEELKDGDIISARLTLISRAMYDYLVAIAADSSGPAMFSGDFCLGYFLAAPTAESSITFRPSEI